ncbi:hypothetical protein M408DRAFT_295056 [Serendipita vermifera MAFF 305830]|uniref:Uncharacterized protein n=1 Tax=Serendipita vermifera MAFF 305830 TaxID=933852 RepID=A0A0C3BFH9_SERVB|nr:hypothetical protein M408DRAFT_295056 [Serendipita vermifera MAFF 305830]
MDFRGALVNNMNANVNSYFQIPHRNGPAHNNTSMSNNRKSGEAHARRRRRRHQNYGIKLATEPSIEEECVLQEHTPPYTPLRTDFGEIPTLQLSEASPVPEFAWPPNDTPQRVPLETLKAIAERARERLAVRIQAYAAEQQKVIEAAARIQNAYSTHMESQLGTIVTTMQGHLSTAIDTKLDSFKQAWHHEIFNTLDNLEVHLPSVTPHSVDPQLVKTARISALEGETQRLVQLMSKEKALESSDTADGDMIAILKRLQEQGERTDRSLKELYSLSTQHALETKDLRDAMKTVGLLPSPSTPQKQRIFGEPGSAKGKYPFTIGKDKENNTSSPLGVSSSPMKPYQNAVANLLDSPQL